MALRVAVDLHDGKVILGSLTEEVLDECRRPGDSVSAARACRVGHELEFVDEQNFRPKRCSSATECNSYRFLPVPWEEMLAQVGVLLSRQAEPDITHAARLSSRSSHSSTSKMCVSMQS